MTAIQSQIRLEITYIFTWVSSLARYFYYFTKAILPQINSYCIILYSTNEIKSWRNDGLLQNKGGHNSVFPPLLAISIVTPNPCTGEVVRQESTNQKALLRKERVKPKADYKGMDNKEQSMDHQPTDFNWRKWIKHDLYKNAAFKNEHSLSFLFFFSSIFGLPNICSEKLPDICISRVEERRKKHEHDVTYAATMMMIIEK